MNTKSILFAGVFFLSANSLFAGVLFTNSTEEPTTQWNSASKSGTNAIIDVLEDKDILDEELKEKELRLGYDKILVEKKIRLGSTSGDYKFIRPATTPFVSYFYGAHAFHYWFVSGSKVLLSSRSDKVTVLSTSHNGMRDIVASNFIAAGRYWYETTYAFDKEGYVPISCFTYEAAKPKEKFACDHEYER